MAFDYRRYEFKRDKVLMDPRNHFEKFKDKLKKPATGSMVFAMSAVAVYAHEWFVYPADILFIYNLLFFIWFMFFSTEYKLPFKMPKSANRIDPNNKPAGSSRPKPAEGILYIGNEERTNEEIWFTNTDARTHILYLGTTGSGKTEGLKAMVTNALGWGSGFIYVDGKADTDLWGSLSSLARRYGRDDDLLILNYMTGNSDLKVASNTVNPFSHGSAPYLTNLLVSLMPEVQGDNAMWKDRAVALISALMPVLTWQRNYQEKTLNITTIRDALDFKAVIDLSRRPEIPERARKELKGYLNTLPGYTDAIFNDDGTEKPNPNGPPADYSTIYQQHGYLAMQFTRQLQSLAGDYGYIFESPSADIDMMDVVLNRRIVVVLIPALEKSADETANLGKIVGSMLKGMMGATLGATVEGDADVALENKPTRSSTPFMAVFDEVGYYTTQGMAVMAAQARSLGFCLIFAGQDLPAMEKRVKEEARSIVANCNLKIFGKLEDPTQTKEFFEKTVGEATVLESSTRKEVKVMFGAKRMDKTDNFQVTKRAKASYEQLKAFKEGQSIVAFGDQVVQAKMFYSQPGKIKSLRVNKFISLPHPDPTGKRSSKDVDAILERVRDSGWTAKNSSKSDANSPLITALNDSFNKIRKAKHEEKEAACIALTQVALKEGLLKPDDLKIAPKPAEKPPEKPSEKPVAPELKAEPRTAIENKLGENVFSPPPAAAKAEPVPARSAPSAPAKTDPSAKALPNIEETISWGALMADDDAAPPPKAKAPPKTSDIDKSKLPSVEESVSWKELMGGSDDKASEASTSAAAPSKPAAPQGLSTGMPGGFGLGGFGSTGFGGGFGGLGGLSSPAGRHTGLGGLGTLSPDKATPSKSQEENKKSPEKAVDEGETVNWKDLLE